MPSREPNPLKTYLLAPLPPSPHTEAHLLLLTLASGLQNAASYFDFRVFASAQTGNTVVFALALADRGPAHPALAAVGTSLAAFCAGALLAGQIGNLVGRRRRVWQVAVQAAQVLGVLGSAWAGSVHGDISARGADGGYARLALGLLGVSCGAQVAAARAWGVPEISTVMATTAWVDLLADGRLLSWENRGRNRRAAFLVVLVGGSVAGAFLREAIGGAGVVVVSAVVKGVVVVGLLVAPGEGVGAGEKGEGREGVRVVDSGDVDDGSYGDAGSFGTDGSYGRVES